MSKYLKTKPGSLESAVLEAVSPAQQAAIAISKKEKGEEPKKEKVECPKCNGEGCEHCDGKGYHEEELTAKQKKIDMNKDGKITGDDLAKLRAKGAKKEEVELEEKIEYVEYKFKNKNDAMKAKSYFDGIQLMSFDVNDDAIGIGELAVDAGNKDMTKYHKEVMKKFKPKVTAQEELSPKQKKIDLNKNGKVDGDDLKKLRQKKDENVQEGKFVGDTGMVEKAAKHISDMWKEASKSKTEEEEPKKKEEKDAKTMTGKPMTKVEVSPSDEVGKK